MSDWDELSPLEIDNQRLRAELAAAKERASKYQGIAAELADRLNGTPCAEIRWQQERDALRAELAAELERADARRKTVSMLCRENAEMEADRDKAEAERDALRALLREAREYVEAAAGDSIDEDAALSFCASIDAALEAKL